jgi:acyl transferase domain-containing protein/acyl carrier protein
MSKNIENYFNKIKVETQKLNHEFINSSVWVGKLTVEHPIIGNHRVYKHNLLPGLAWIDLLYQWLYAINVSCKNLEIRRLSLYQPLIITGDCPVVLSIEAVKTDDYWKVTAYEGTDDENLIARPTIQTKRVSTTERKQSKFRRLYMAAEIKIVSDICFENIFRQDEIFTEKNISYVLQDVYNKAKKRGLTHTKTMKANGSICITSDSLWGRVKANNDSFENPKYIFHPALLDSSGLCFLELFNSYANNIKHLFLPLYFESFHASEPFGNECYFCIKKNTIKSKKEILSATIEYYNAKGRKIAELKNLTVKLVRKRGFGEIKRDQKQQPSPQGINMLSLPKISNSFESIKFFLCALLGAELGVPPKSIDADLGYYELGLDSAILLKIVTILEKHLNVALAPTLLFEHSTVNDLSVYLSKIYLATNKTTPNSDAGNSKLKREVPKTHFAKSRCLEIPTHVPLASYKMRKKTNTKDVAVIGIAGRYPQANSIRQFWSNLKRGVDSIIEIPKKRWDKNIFSDLRSPSGKKLSIWGGFIDDVDCFDAQFFRVSPREAENMDPQERLFLQTCWEAIEDSGYTPSDIVPSLENTGTGRNVGVFVGVMHKDYTLIQAESVLRGEKIPMSLNYASIANRVSYFCDFHGPSITVDTVCSSSLTALHLAVESILHGECRVALAGGVNLSLHPDKYLSYGIMDFHSSDGRCRTFGEGGDGYVSAEGVGALVLKPLNQAVQDGDTVYAVIKGTSINHGGSVSGITVPSPIAQKNVIIGCLKKAQIDPETIQYVEAHGTGTSLGDPIEIRGLSLAFNEFTDKKQFCALGSVKSNIGHAESAAGISGITKTILQLHNKTLVKSLHAETINPHLELNNSPFYIQHRTEKWKLADKSSFSRRAGVSSFGASGSNVHIILEEAPEQSLAINNRHHYLILLSAKTNKALKQRQQDLIDWLITVKSSKPTVILSSISYTTNVGRCHFSNRVAYVVTNKQTLLSSLQHSLGSEESPSFYQGIVDKNKKPDDDAIYKKVIKNLMMELKQAQQDVMQYKEALEALANLYVKGYDISWEELYTNEEKRRISLPTYPFAKDRYWISNFSAPVNTNNEGISSLQASLHSNEEKSIMRFYTPCWRATELTNTITSNDAKTAVAFNCLLVFSDSESFVSEIKQTFISTQFNFILIRIQSGEAYKSISKTHYQIKPGNKRDYEVLFATLHELYPRVVWNRIVNYWDEKIDGAVKIAGPVFEKNGCHLLALSQILLSSKVSDVRLLHIYPFMKDKLILAEMLNGFVRTIREEHSDYLYKVIGVDETCQKPEKLLKIIRDELRFGIELQVRYRNKQRYENNFVVTDLSPEKFNINNTVKLKSGAVYLITGGLGKLGVIFARYVAKNFQAKLILIGRSKLDTERQHIIDDIRKLGGDIVYMSADISKRKEVEQLLKYAVKKFGTLDGIIHAAGLASNALIIKEETSAFINNSRAKIMGCYYLDELTKPYKLDFFVLFSSVSSCLMNTGCITYSCANAFMDYFAHYRNQLQIQGQRFGHTVSINWPLWKDGGMQPDMSTKKMLFDLFGMSLLSKKDGINAFNRILHSGLSQVMPMFGKQTKFSNQLFPCENNNKNTPSSRILDVEKDNFEIAKNGLQNKIIQAISTVLKLAATEISLEENFSQYGFDSISLTELANKLNNCYSLKLTPALFYQYSTVTEIADYLLKNHRSKIERAGDVTTKFSSRSNSCEISVGNVRTSGQGNLTEETNMFPLIAKSSCDIAIIGMAGVFPGASNVDDLWRNLVSGYDAITHFPKERTELNSAKKFIDWGGFVKDIDKFDADFFNISPREAELMDPQQRIFLETVCKSIEDAGYAIENFSGTRCALFAGVQFKEYEKLIEQQNEFDSLLSIGNAHSILVNRVSYLLNLTGPSEAIDTACSSSLVAIHRAIQSIQLGESDIAIAGGVNGLFGSGSFISCTKAGMLCSNGRCKAFDKDADGYVRSEGAGAIVLKPLGAAQTDKDHIYGIIKGSAVNHGGHVNTLTSPNPNAQAEVIKTACQKANITPDTIGYIEAHGTGTPLGDPIEINGLKKAFSDLAKKQGVPLKKNYCAIGTIKTNIGHLETAAGIAGVIKTLLALKHEQIPANLRFKELNPYIELEETPFYIAKNRHNWPRIKDKKGKPLPRRAGVSSFGFGGSNAHLILEEAPSPQEYTATKPYYLIILTAKSENSLMQQQKNLLNWLLVAKKATTERLLAISFTLNVGRSHYAHRIAFVVQSEKSLRQRLENALERPPNGKYFKGVLEKNKILEDDAIYKKVMQGLVEELRRGNQLDCKYKETLEALANLFVKGYEINWELLYQNEVKQRISLPTYPFIRERYWIPKIKLRSEVYVGEIVSSLQDSMPVIKKELSVAFYKPNWRISALTQPESPSASNTCFEYLLLFVDNSECASKMVRELKSSKHNRILVSVQSGEKYQRISSDRYTINPGNKPDYDQLFNELNTLYPKNSWNYIVDYWSGNPGVKTRDIETRFKKRAYHLLAMAQTLLSRDVSKARLLHIYPYNDDDKLVLDEMNNGFVRSLKKEHPGYLFQLIGVDENHQTPRELYRIIENEFICGADQQVHYMQKNRLVNRYISTELECGSLSGKGRHQFRKNGVYLLTGGLGSLGVIFARYLAENYKAKLILVGRSKLNKVKRQLIADIESLGADVKYISADVGERKEVLSIVQTCKKQYGVINGVIHAAGILKDAFVTRKSLKEMKKVFKPKVYGLLFLDEALKNENKLDCFIIFSSVAGALGNVGQADYAAANSFMDHYAHYREQLRKQEKRYGKTICISWPLWADGGMQVEKALQEHFFSLYGMGLLSTKDGIYILNRALRCDELNILPVFGQQEKFIRTCLNNESNENEHSMNNITSFSKDNHNQLLMTTQNKIVEIVSEILKINSEKISLKESLARYGFGSMTLTVLADKLNDYYSVKLTPAMFYQYSTIASVAEHLLQENVDKLISAHKELLICSDIEPSPASEYSAEEPQLQIGKKLVFTNEEDIAVIGMAGRFPGASDVNSLWKNLVAGRDSITHFPEERAELKAAKYLINWGGFIDDVDKFDAAFFNITPREAELMDPQQRIFLQTVWKSIEDAGYTTSDFSGKRCGLFAGVQFKEYEKLITRTGEYNALMGTGNAHSILVNRVSFLLNITGPSEAIDTACSSTLVAIHRAVHSIQTGESELAIAGGVNCLLDSDNFIGCVNVGMLSKDGRCKTFDKSANGYVRGEGVGAIVLKPLSKAKIDGDNIYGVIKASAVNHGGHVNTLTAPNPISQSELIKYTCKKASISPDTISYIEAHGTGTSLGDPIEINGLKKAFSELAEEKQLKLKNHFCGIGSIKTNIGHLETAAGIASIIKVLLALRYRQIPASLHCKELNPYIDLKDSPFCIVSTLQEWKKLKDDKNHEIPRRAGVSSFGFGGSNAHVILEEAPEQQVVKDIKPFYLITLSAKTANGLKRRQNDLLKWLEESTAISATAALSSISFTLNLGRTHFSHRRAWIVKNREELKAELLLSLADKKSEHAFIGIAEDNQRPDDEVIYEKVLEETYIELRSTVPENGKKYQRNLHILANLYVKGYTINWSLLYSGTIRRRISLPSYPFEKIRYWIPEIYLEEKQVHERNVENLVHYSDAILQDGKQLTDAVENKIKTLVAKVAKFDITKILLTEDLVKYGFDSITFTELANYVNKCYQTEMTPASFYEHPTIQELSKYLVENCLIKIKKCHGFDKTEFLPEHDSIKATLPTKVQSSNNHELQDIAVIGMAGIFPGAADINTLWDNLIAGRDSITTFPADRTDLHAAKQLINFGGFIEDIDKFDAGFFNISPREAELMDPQQRIFLQTVCNSIEDAGYALSDFKGTSTSLFVGVGAQDYFEILVKTGEIEGYALTGLTHSILANRVSYLLGLTGSSEAIDTACSSSLVAIHRAIQSIQAGESEQAIAGGVNGLLSAGAFIGNAKAGMLSKDGRCKTFDKGANGYVRGEGVGAVVLKPLQRAKTDGDHIYGIIKASAVNHGGNVNTLTAPNPKAQAELIKMACRKANITPDTIGYIEAHGTGTSLGDPIEINGLKKAFKELSDENKQTLGTHYCGIASIKTNIGHLEAAAGVAGIIKTLLALENKQLPASLHCKELNPYIELKESPFYVIKKRQKWNRLKSDAGQEIARRAGVSSFGFGGSNAHIILEEAPSRAGIADTKPFYLVTVTAKTEQALKKRLLDLRKWLDSNKNKSAYLSEISYTLNVGRDQYAHRIAWVVRNKKDFYEQLNISIENKSGDLGFNGILDKYKKSDDDAIYKKVMQGLLAELQQGGQNETQYKETLEALANLYVKGYKINWDLLYKNEVMCRISLPTYPFVKEKYWIPQAEVTDEDNTLSLKEESVIGGELKLAFYEQRWKATKTLDEDLSNPSIDCLIIFVNSDSLMTRIQDEIKIGDEIRKVVYVQPGEHYKQVTRDTYIVKPGRKQDYEQFFSDLHTAHSNTKWNRIVDYWSTDSKRNTKIININMENGCYHLLALSQVWLINKVSNVRLLHIYPYAKDQIVIDEMNAGFVRSLQEEHPDYFYQTIGVDVNTQTAQELVRIIKYEFKHGIESQAHYLDGQRFVNEFSVIDLDIQNSVTSDDSIKLRSKGVYLITGGLGGLGVIFAKYLAKNFNAKLVLVGRSPLDNNRNKLINDIRKLGAEVKYISADVGKRKDLERVILQSKDSFHVLNGIIHAAGLPSKTFILEEKSDSFQRLSEAKIKGCCYLDELTRNCKLDFMVLFSSVSSYLMNTSLSPYASANSFMDHFAHYRNELLGQNKRYGKTISINWPLWANGGMQVEKSTQQALLTSFGMGLLETIDGLGAFIDILKYAPTQIMPIFGRQPQFNRELMNLNKSTIRESACDISTFDPNSRDALLKAVMLKLKEIVGKILKLDTHKIDINGDLAQYGCDSLALAELASNLNKYYSTKLTPAMFYQYSTISAIAEHLIESCSDNVIRSHENDLPADKRNMYDSLIDHNISKAAVESKFQSQRKIRQVCEREVAVIGMAGIFPGADNVGELWNNLITGYDAITPFPDDRSGLALAKKYINWGGFIKDIDKFDADFFNISPKEAELMDPQQRIFLQTVCGSIEDAGYGIDELSGTRTALFAGAGAADYFELLKQDSEIEGHTITGVSQSILPNRVSYLLGLNGPSEAINTACSSSLVAIHRAVQSIQSGESDMAIAGGVNCLLSSTIFVGCAQSGMLSEDGHCKSFSSSANGYVRSEGVGAILMKPLSSAKKDGNHIYAIIKASAVNHGGHVNTLTAPNPNAQARLIKEVCHKAQVDPNTINYIEAHGTGTPLGDPIEINALKQAFNELAAESNQSLTDSFCGVGSIKSSIGHTETAAGISGVIKTLLALKNKQIPASLHCEELNPYIELEKTPFYITTKLHTWDKLKDIHNRELPRRAGVSSFGFGGSNAHILLEEAPDHETVIDSKPCYLITLSAKTSTAFKQRQKNLLAWLKTDDNKIALSSISYTLNTGRTHFDYREAWVVRSKEELVSQLKLSIADKNGREEFVESINDQKLEGDAIYERILEEILKELPTLIKKNEKKYQKNLKTLADFYAKGHTINWRLLHDGEAQQKVSLPTYPFAKERYWIPENNAKNKQTPEKTKNYSLKEIENYLDCLELQAKRGVAISDSEIKKIISREKIKTLNASIINRIYSLVFSEKTPSSIGLKQQENTGDLIVKLELLIKEKLMETLKIKTVNLNKSFRRYGLDSVLVMRFVMRLEKTLNLDIEPQWLLDFPTVSSLAKQLACVMQ